MTTTDLSRRPTALSRRHLLAPLPAAAFAVLLCVSGTSAAHAAAGEEAAPEVSVAAAAQGVLHPGATLNATITVENPGDAPLEAATAVLELGREALADRGELRAWLDGDADDVELAPVGTTGGDDIAAGQTDTFGISVEADDRGLADLDPGVYPLRARYGSASADSVVVISDADEPVGIVVPLTAPSPEAGLLDADALAELTGPEGDLTARLNAAAGSEAILAVDPAIPAAIRALGDAAPVSALEWLDRLMLLPNDRFALQFGDADVAAQLQAGLSEPMKPVSLAGYVAAEPDPEPSPTPTESVASVPEAEQEQLDLDELLDIGDAEATLYWPVPGEATAAVIDGLSAADGDAATLTPSGATEQGADGAAVPARGVTAGGGAALVYDSGASAALDAVAATRDDAERSAAAVAATAELWFAGEEAGDAPLLVALDRIAPADEDATQEDSAELPADAEEQLSSAVEVVTLSSAIAPQRLADLIDADPRRITPTETAPDETRAAFVSELAQAEERVSVTATVLDDPDTLKGVVRAEAQQVLGVGWATDRTSWEDVVAGFRERTRERADAVAIQDPTPVQLISAGADLPVWIRNDLPYPVTVTLLARPADPRLDVADRTTVTAQPRSSTAVQVPVGARVGSGQVDIDLTLVSSTGALIGSPQTVEVTVRADWERIGIGILVALIAGLLIVGVFRTVRRRRRAAASAAPDQAGPSAADAPTADPQTKGSDA